jgi:sugar phosphate isomerase/epimerase
MQRPVSRRAMLGTSAALLGAASASAVSNTDKRPMKVAIFSKHLLFLQGEQLAQGASEIGFDGVDLAVRKGGHVAPERVKQDLPPLISILRKHGLEVPMITTDIVDADTPYAEDILSTASQLGIRYYRWGGLTYKPDVPLAQQLDAMKPRVEKLAALNARYRATAMYHTHSGLNVVGASIWDLHELLSGMDPASIGVNYDIGHATVEGGFGGWINSYRITGKYLHGIAVKDFLWEKKGPDNWRSAWKPLGEGMVRLPEFFKMVAGSQFNGPLQLHFEYPLGGAENGKTQVADSSAVFAQMRRDLQQLRTYLRGSGLA